MSAYVYTCVSVCMFYYMHNYTASMPQFGIHSSYHGDDIGHHGNWIPNCGIIRKFLASSYQYTLCIRSIFLQNLLAVFIYIVHSITYLAALYECFGLNMASGALLLYTVRQTFCCKRAIMESFITALCYTWHPECFNCLVSIACNNMSIYSYTELVHLVTATYL